MTNRVQALRSAVTTNLPPQGTAAPGVVWVNWPDMQFGTMDATKTPQKLLAVRYFATTATYVAGEVVVQAGAIYTANTSISPGAFNAGQWNKNAQLTDIPAPYVLPKATTTTLGGVMVDGTTVLVDGTGKISSIGIIYMGPAPPGAPVAGNLWWDSIGGQLYVYYDDGNTRQWTVAVNQNLSNAYLPLIGGTLSGNIAIVAPSPAIQLMKTVAGNANGIYGAAPSSLQRWGLTLGDGTAESGAQVGSDFTLNSYDDSGTFNFNVMRAFRSNGSVYFPGQATVGGTLTTTAGATIGTTLSVGTVFYPSFNNANDWYFLSNSTDRIQYWRAPDAYEYWHNATGLLTWVQGNAVAMTLDYGGNLVVAHNLTANGNFNTNQINAGNIIASGNVQCTAGTLYAAQAQVQNNNGINYSNFGGYWYAFAHDANALYVQVNGTSGRYILFSAGSDDRIKRDAKPSPYGLKEILATEPIIFTYKNNHGFPAADGKLPQRDLPEPPADERLHIGVSAQRQERIMPEMIGKRDGFIDGQPVDDLRSFINHEWMTYALVNAVKELAARVAQLEGASGYGPVGKTQIRGAV